MKDKIDIKAWKRNKQYTHFLKFSNPYASASTIINVNNIVNYAKKHKVSFYGIMTYLVMKSINQVEEFKYVLEEDGVYKYNQILFLPKQKQKTLSILNTIKNVTSVI